MESLPIRMASVELAIALETRSFALSNDDPADRITSATARVHGLVLVTADRILLEASDVPTLDAS